MCEIFRVNPFNFKKNSITLRPTIRITKYTVMAHMFDITTAIIATATAGATVACATTVTTATTTTPLGVQLF